MKVNDWLVRATKLLNDSGITTARLDSIVLLEDCLEMDRAQILARPELEISDYNEAELEKLLKRRASHEPLAYMRGKTEFFAREFIVSPAVLEPRPESETMIELLLAQTNLPKDPFVADVGTGSGALGITAALELPGSHVELLDIDEAALEVAKSNVDFFTAPVSIKKSDLLSNSSQQNDILLCNLPYVPDGHTVNEAALHEPKIAIFGGPDGLDLYRRLFKQVTKLSKRPLYILTEALPSQHEALATIADESGYRCSQKDDFIQLFSEH